MGVNWLKTSSSPPPRQRTTEHSLLTVYKRAPTGGPMGLEMAASRAASMVIGDLRPVLFCCRRPYGCWKLCQWSGFGVHNSLWTTNMYLGRLKIHATLAAVSKSLWLNNFRSCISLGRFVFSSGRKTVAANDLTFVNPTVRCREQQVQSGIVSSIAIERNAIPYLPHLMK